MKIVIVGAGEVGSHLAKLLSTEEQDIMIVDSNAAKLEELDANYNLITLAGDPTSFATLRNANVSSCDLFIAVTPYENDNIVACGMARTLGAKCTVARIDSYDFMEPLNSDFVAKMGVDRLIYPEYLATLEILSALRHSWTRQWFDLYDGEIILVGVRIREGAPITGQALKDFAFSNRHFHVSAIRRNAETIIPRGADVLMPEDIVYVTTTREHINELIELTGKKKTKIRNIVIMGGGKIAVKLVDMARGKYRITIIDNDMATCRRLPELCPDCEIFYGDARDPEVLKEAGIMEADAFVALSPSSESNILTCLTAKGFGVKRTVAEVENIQFISQAENLNIGKVINKKLLASSGIFQLLLDQDSSTSRSLALTDAEVAELEVKPGAKIAGKPVKDLKLSSSMTLAGLLRNGEGHLISGNTVIEPGDHVLVFCLAGSLRKVEKLFN